MWWKPPLTIVVLSSFFFKALCRSKFVEDKSRGLNIGKGLDLPLVP